MGRVLADGGILVIDGWQVGGNEGFPWSPFRQNPSSHQTTVKAREVLYDNKRQFKHQVVIGCIQMTIDG